MAFTYEATNADAFVDVAVDNRNTLFICGSVCSEYFSYMGIKVKNVDAELLHRIATTIIGTVHEKCLSYCAGTQFTKTDVVTDHLINTLIETSDIVFEYDGSDYDTFVNRYPFIVNASVM